MKIKLYGRKRLWFWVPMLVFWLVMVTLSVIDDGFDPICFGISLIPALLFIWQIIRVCIQPDFTESDYLWSKAVEQTVNNMVICKTCGKSTPAILLQCIHCEGSVNADYRDFDEKYHRRINVQKSNILCPSCGKTNSILDPRCKFCGNAIVDINREQEF